MGRRRPGAKGGLGAKPRSAAWGLLVFALGACDCGSSAHRFQNDAGRDAAEDARVPDGGSPDAAVPADAGADEGVDASIAPQCVGEPDFTSCSVVTAPDRSYDICVEDACVSPGCGTAECNAPGPHFPLADTGQRTCYDVAGNAIDCASCGSVCGQDAQLGWDVTHAASERFDRTAAQESVVTDTVTGLTWQGCPAGLDGTGCTEGTLTELAWPDALAYCNALSWGGFDDWRLPDEYELHALIDYEVTGTAIDLDAFPGTIDRWTISASTYAGDERGAWYPFWYGTGYWGVVIPKASSTGQVRCVRDSPAPVLVAERLVRDLSTPGEPVVDDAVTALAWQGCEAGRSGDACATGSLTTMSWEGALGYCEGLDWGGHADWHLPDVKQLRSISHNHHVQPGVDPAAFPETNGLPAWTSTTDPASPAEAWMVTIGFGGGIQQGNKTEMLAVRCVRLP